MAQFNLAQSPEQLAFAQEKSANASYQQYNPTSSAIGANFPNGTIVIPFSLSQPMWYTPAKSFVRLLINTSYPLPAGSQLNPTVATMASGSPFLQQQGIAPAMFQAASLFSRIEFLVNGVTVDLLSDWTPQCHSFLERTLRPKANLDSFQFSKDFTDPDFHTRQARVTQPVLDLGIPDQSNLSLSIYDIGVPYPVIGGSLTATLSADGTTCTLTSNVAILAGFQTLVTYFRAGDVLSVLEFATQPTQFQGFVRDIVPNANGLTCVITLTNTSGVTGAGYTVGAVGNPAGVYIERVQARQINNTYELLWKPPIASWQGDTAIPGGAFCELRLTPWPQSVYQARAIESLQPGRIAGRDFQVVIQDLSLQLYTQAGPRVESLNWLWPLDFSCMCQAQSITAGANSLLQLNFDCPSSTYYFGIALQSRNLNDSSISSTKFTVKDPNNFNANLEQSVTRLFIQWKGQSLPPQRQELFYKEYERDPDPLTNPPGSSGNDQFCMRYCMTQLNSGLAFASSEREIDWLDRGPIYSFFVPSDVSAQSTRLQVNIQTSVDLTQLANVLVFAISRKVASVTMDAGRYTSVVVQDL